MAPDYGRHMPVEPALLDLQAHDMAADRLRRTLATLTEAALVAEAESRRAETAAQLGALEAERSEAEKNRNRLDGEVAVLTEKVKAAEGKLYGGAVSHPRELSALQADVAMIRRQRSVLEEAELIEMERVEELDVAITPLADQLASLDVELEGLRAEAFAAAGLVQVELDAALAAREEGAARIGADLLALYERIRGQNDGLGAAALVDGVCQGCHIRLAGADLAEARTADAPRCESCRVLLVVT